MADSLREYIALIRGINVGGRSLVKMADLRKLFDSLGSKDVVTYIQTGNVLFWTEEDDLGRLEKQLEEKLAPMTGRKTRVFVLSPAELKKAAEDNPFDPENRDPEQQCHLMFLSAEPDQMSREALMALQGEEYRFYIEGKVLFYAYSRKYEGRRRTINFEKVLRVAGTSRTWKVVNKLVEMSGR